MSEIINKIETTTNQAAKKQNWCGIIGFAAVILALILAIVTVSIDSGPSLSRAERAKAEMTLLRGGVVMGDFTAMYVFIASLISAFAGLILSIIGLFFKPRKFAVAGAMILLLFAIMAIMPIMANV